MRTQQASSDLSSNTHLGVVRVDKMILGGTEPAQLGLRLFQPGGHEALR